jgi:hypothetical protein
VRKVRRGLFEDIALLLQADVFFPQTLEFFIQMFVMDLLLLASKPVIFPDLGVSGVFLDPKVTGRLGNRLFRFDR